MHRLGLAFALTAGIAPTIWAASPDPNDLVIPASEDARARELVRRLGSGAYRERQLAQSELARMGRLARPALLDAATSDPSPEIRFRCQDLLPKAEAAELKARIDTFLADTEGRYDHDLPGWDEFRVATGAERQVFGIRATTDPVKLRAARKIFVEMLADSLNRDMLGAIADPPEELARVVAARKQELYGWRLGRPAFGGPVTPPREPTAIDILTLLFAESLVGTREIPVGRGAVVVTNLFYNSGLSAAVTDPGERGLVYRAIVTRWADTRSDPITMYSAIQMLRNMNMPDVSLRVSVRLFTTPGATGIYRAQAATTIIQQATREHLPMLETALTDASVLTNTLRIVNNQQMRTEIQARDVALVAAILITGQNPADYGFVEQYRGSGTRAGYSYSSWQMTEDKRDAALAKWKAWRAANPDTK